MILGSNLKFRKTEYGTLEIVSMVDTEQGQIECSTGTEDKKPTGKDGVIYLFQDNLFNASYMGSGCPISQAKGW